MSAATITHMTYAEWQAEGVRRFGEDPMEWQFVCPVCKNVAKMGDFEQYADQGATPNSATCQCIGRYQKESRDAFNEQKKSAPKQPCNYAGYGLFALSPLRVTTEEGKEVHCFAFAEVSA
jgi:hypothetical protein